MTTITPTDFRVVRDDGASLSAKAGETISSRKGKFLRIDPTTSLAMLGNASSAAEAGGAAGHGGFAMSDQAQVGDAVTLFRRGLIDWGTGLDSVANGALVYLGDTDSLFQDSAGTVTVVLGKVHAVVESDGSVKKFLLADIQ